MIRNKLITILLLLLVQGAYAQASFSIKGAHCQNKSLQFINESSITIDSLYWDFGDGSNSTLENPFHTFNNDAEYSVQFIIYYGVSSDTTTQAITIGANPIADFKIDTTLYSSYTRIFTDVSETNSLTNKYLWYFGDNTDTLRTDSNNVQYKYQKEGNYNVWLKIIDVNACTDSISQWITVNNLFRVPNVFTPNGDPHNEEFIVTTNGIELFEISIYGRLGNLVFERKGHQQIIWDGRMPNGEKVKPGTYFYVINVLNSNTIYTPTTGFVSIFY